MSASIALTIWKSPIRWPNWRRSLAYAVGDLERALGDPDGLRGDPWSTAVERAHRQVEAVAFVADQVRRRNANASEGELGGRAAAETHLVLETGDREAGVSEPRRRSTTAADGAARRGSVTAKTVMRSATEAWVMNRFEPVMTYSSPSRTARVRAATASEPDLGLGQCEGDEVLARTQASGSIAPSARACRR